MRYALVGNNDGPLRLLRSLKAENGHLPVFLGLQKEPEPQLLADYHAEIGDNTPFSTDFDENRLLELLNPFRPQIIINCFCNFKFTTLLEKYTCYNIHPSYLPAYRGRHPMHWALINGEKDHGITLHQMTMKYDTGGIVWQKSTPINENMSVAELRERLMQLLEKAFPKALKWLLQGNFSFKEKPFERGGYIPRRGPRDSQLTEWDVPDLIYRKIKALRSEVNPAFLSLKNGKKLPIINVERADNETPKLDEKPPFILEVKKNAIWVQLNGKESLCLIFEENQAVSNPENILFYEH